MVSRRHAVRSACVSAVVALGASGCFLPIPFTERASPVVIGRYWHPDGMPSAHARVAVTSHHDDATCARALERATTDSMGVFRLRATTVRRRGLWIVPAIERFGNAYWLCAGDADTPLQMAYAGSVSFVVPSTVPDSITCLEWGWEGRRRVTCSGPNEARALQTGGSWNGGAEGFYRLIVIEAAWDAREPGVFLQWVQRSDPSAGETVRETVALPLVAGLLEIEEVWFWLPRGRPPCVSVDSRGKPPRFLSWGPGRERVAFELGPPGQMRRVTSC
jgi:hypothetical protein